MTTTEKTIERRVWSPASLHAYTQQRIEKACVENQPSLQAFAAWLAEIRGLAPGTIASRIGSTCTFVDDVTSCGAKTCTETFRLLRPEDIEDFFIRYGRDHRMPARRSMQASMRLFLKFAAAKGWAGMELVDSVPILSSHRLSNLPRGLSDEEISTLLSSEWKGRCRYRDRAIIYLLATYGVRRAQVSALRFEDVNWEERTILFTAHKGGKAVYQALTQAVAQSLSEYIQKERPKVDCDGDYIFLRRLRPYARLNPAAITQMVRARMVACGLPPRSPHAFRHAYATRLLRAGQPIKAIADLLGHRSLDAVAIYAKVDYNRLLEAAAEWPEVMP